MSKPTDLIFLVGSLAKMAEEQGLSEEHFAGALAGFLKVQKDPIAHVAHPSPLLRAAAAAAALATPTTANKKRKTDPEFLALQMQHKREGWTEERFTAELMKLRNEREEEEKKKWESPLASLNAEIKQITEGIEKEKEEEKKRRKKAWQEQTPFEVISAGLKKLAEEKEKAKAWGQGREFELPLKQPKPPPTTPTTSPRREKRSFQAYVEDAPETEH